MSTEWGFACKQCKNEDGYPIQDTWFSRRPELVQLCYKAWPHAKAIHELDPDGYINLSVFGDCGETDIWDFLATHYEHGLWQANEYGTRWRIDAEPYKDSPVDMEAEEAI